MKGANNYLRNVAKSITYAAVDVANEELMSETIDFAKNNKEFIAATYAALRNPAAALKKSIKAIQQSKIYQALDYGVKNTFEDLRTGNFYNKEREERDVGKLSGIDASDYNDLSEFGIDDDWESMLNDDGGGRSKSSKVTKEITSGDLEIIESIEGSNAAAANATVNAVLHSSEAQMKNARINTGSLYMQNERLFGGLHKDISILGTTVDNIQKITSASLQNIDKNMSEFFTSESKLSSERNSILKEMLEILRANNKSAVDKEKEANSKTKKKIRWADINSSGMPDFDNYIEAIKTNFSKEISSVLPQFGDGEDNNIFAAFATSPLSYVIKPLVSAFIPATFKIASQELDKTLSSVFGQFIGRMANNKNSNGIWQYVAKFLGVNTGVNRSIATNKYEQGPVPFDGITRKAITDVIPSYLRRIEAFLTRSPEQTFDYDAGRWITMRDVQKTHENIHKNAINNGTKEIMDAMKPALNKMKYSNSTDLESFNEAIEEFKQYLYDHNGIFNPNASREKNGIDFANYRNLYNHYNEIVIAYKNFDRTRSVSRGGEKVRNTNYSARLGIAKSVLSAKDAEERAYRDLESKISTPMQQYYAAFGIDKHGKWDKDTNKFKSDNLLLNSKDKDGNTVFNYLKNINAELTWQRQAGFEDILSALLSSNVFSNNNKPRGKKRRNRNNNQNSTNENTEFESNLRNLVYSRHNNTFNKIFANLNRNNELEQENNAKTRNRQANLDKAKELIRTGKSVDMSVLLKDIENEDGEINKEELEEAVNIINGLLEEHNSKEYKDAVTALNGSGIANTVEKYFFGENVKSIEDFRKEIEKAEKEAEKEKPEREEIEKEKSILSGLLDKVKDAGSLAGGIAGATADVFTNLMYATDRAIYEMMYKTELKDDEDAKEYNGFMDLISGKINKTFEKAGKDLKESIIDPFKKRLGIDEDWTQKFKDSLGNIGSSLWKNFIEANKDIYGPLWGMVKTELGFKDGETIAEKQRRAARRDISDDLKIIDSISSVYDIRYIDMMAEYGLNPIDYGTNFDAAIDALKKAAQARYIKNTNNLKDLSKDHSDDEERKKVIKFANSAQLLEIAAEHGIKQSEVENFKLSDGTWNNENLRNFIEDYIFNNINKDSLRKALNVLNRADEKGNKRFTDEQVERILSGDYNSTPDWQKETRDLIAQDAINKIKNQSDETLLSNVLNKNKDSYDAFRGKALGLEGNSYNSLLDTLNNNGIDITPFIDDPDSLTLDKAIELLLAANGNNEYILMAKNKGFKYNAENAESNISQVVEAATKYNTSKSIGEVINNFIDNMQTYNLNKYSNARIKALGFTGSIDEKRAKLKELTGRSDEDLAKYTTDEQLDKEFISFVDAHGLEQIQFAKTFGFASNDRAKQIDQIVTLASKIDDEDLMSSAKSLTNQQLLDKFIELNKINLNEEIAKVLLDGNITKETIIDAMGENIAEQLRSDKNLNSEAAWSSEHYRRSHKSMDTNLEIADLMGISSDRSDIEKDIIDAAINKVFKQIDPNKTQTGDYTDIFNIVSNILEDGSKIKEAEQNGLKGNLRQKREIAIKFIEAEAERRKKKFEGNHEQIDAINEERDKDIEKIQNATEYDLSDYFVKHGFRNNAEGTLSGKPFMGDTMLSKGELLFNSKGVSRVPKTDAYRLNEPTHILNSEESDNILSMLGVDHKYLANSSIQKDLANENKIKEKLFSDKYIANHADSTVNITNNGVNSNKFLDEAKAYLPEGAAGGLVGGILSLVFNLVGGPLVGAAVGAAGSIISKSDIFKDALFGKKIGDGNERDDSGFISKTIVDKVKKTAPNMFKYGLAGIIPGLITPLGPIGGLIAGAAIGMLRSNEAFTNKYFGEGGKLSIKSEDKEMLDKLIPGALKGAGAGAIAGLVFGGPFGLMGNAIIGSALGMMASTSEFKEAMLGTDINGQREGGLVGILKESLSPITDALEEVKSKLVSAVDKHIVDPLERFIRPAIHALPKLLGVVPQFLVDWLDKKTENIRRDLAGKIRDFILPKAEFVGKMLSPITSLATLPFRLPGRIIGGAGDRLRKFDIKHGDLVGMSAAEAVEWMDDHKWGNEVDPLLRAAAGVTDKNQAKKAASLLNAMNTTEASAKRNFNDKNHNLNRLLETYKTSDGKRLSKDQINTVLKYAKDEKYDKIAGVLTGMPLNGTNHGMSQEEFNNLMDNRGLRSAISGLAESHKRKELIRTMSNGQITDEAKVALHDLGIDPSTFDITNKKDRAKFAKLLNEQALHLETNPEEEHLAQDNHDNIDNMNDTLTDIYGVLLDYLLGNNRIPKTTGDAADTALGAGINRENSKYRKAYTHIEKSLKRSGMNTDALSDKSKSAITKGYIDKGFGDMSNAHVASSMSAEFINMAVEHDITELDTIAFIDKKLQPLITDEGMQAIANLDKTRLGYLERWLGGSSDIKTAIIKGRYPLDADAINIISSEITTNTQRLEDNCRLINQAKAWDKYKSLKEIDNLSLNDKYVIRGNANVKDTTFSGVFHKDIAAVRDKVWNTVRHPFRTFGRIVNAASDTAEINAAKSRIRNKDREQELPIGEPIASHGLGTFLLSGIGNLAKGIMSLFNKKDDESEGGEKKPGLFNKLLSALPFGKNQAYGDNYASASYGGGQFDEVDTPNDGKDIVQIGADFAQVKRGSDGSVELDESDSNTKQIINKLNLKEKIAEKVQQAQLKATEILKNAFDVSDTNEGKSGRLKWWQIAITGAYLWKSGILGRLYNGVVKPIWNTALKPWIVEKAIPWIQNDFIPGIGKFFEDLGITIGNVASFVYTDVLVPAWKDHIKPWFKDTVGPWIMNKFLPEVGRLIGTGVKFIIESLPTIIKGGAVLTGGILDAFTGNTTNVGAVTTVDPSKLTGEGKFTNEKGEELSVEDIQNGNYKKIYNSEGAEGVVNKNGNLEFKDKSFHGSSYLKAAANLGYHALINPRMGMKTADLLVKGGDVTYKTLSHLGMPGKIVGKGAQITSRALSAPTKGAAKLGEKAYSKIFGKSLVKGVDPSKAVESANSLIEQTTGKAGESVIKGTGTAVQEVAETATKKSGIVARMIQKISGFIDNLLSNSKVAQKIAKVAGDIGESSAGKFVKKLKDKVMKVIGEAGEKAAKKMGFETLKDAVSKAIFVISIVQGVIDFGLGWDRAESILGVTECTTIEKLVCGIVNAVFNYFSILSIVPGVNWTCRTILGFFEKDLKERQAKAEAEYKKYKEQTGSTKTKEEYLASKYSVSGKVGDWAKDKAGKAFEKAKSGVSKAWNSTKELGSAIGDVVTNPSKIKDIPGIMSVGERGLRTFALRGDINGLMKFSINDKDAGDQDSTIKIVNAILGVRKIMYTPETLLNKAMLLIRDNFKATLKTMGSIPSIYSNTVSTVSNVIKSGDMTKLYTLQPCKGTNIVELVFNGLFNTIKPVLMLPTLLFKAINSINEKFNGALNGLKEKLGSFVDFCADPIGFIIKLATNGGGTTTTTDNTSSNSSGSVLSNAWNAVKSGVSNAWKWFTGTGAKYGTGYSKQNDPEISNIRFNGSNDSKYQTIGDSGCGPAAAVNAIEAIRYGRGNEVVDAANYALKNGYKEKDGGTMPGFFNDYFAKNGYNSQTTYNKQQLKKNIISGAPTVLMGTDPKGVSSSTPYGRYPHYVTATGVDENGHVIIQDPESKYDNQLYSMDDVINNTQFGVSTFGTGKYGKGTEEDIWNYLKNDLKMTDAGAAGLMGNMYAESSLKPNNLEGIYEKKLGMTDKSYTEAVDNGKYSKSKFSNDWAGYGLVQWTYPTRKKALYEYIKAKKLSIASVPGQLGYLNKELSSGYSGVLNTLKSANTVREASDAVMLKFEKPKDTSEKKRQQRAEYGNKYYTKFSGKTVPSTTTNDTNTSEEESHELGLNDIITLASNFFSSLFSSSDGTASVSSTLYDNNYSTSNSNQAAAIVKVAQGEVGTKESGNNRVKYVDWYYGKSGKSMAWCCAFVAWCANQAGISTNIIPKIASCSAMYNGLISHGGKIISGSNAAPGDILFVKNGSSGYKHIAIVENRSGDKINSIDGNYSNKVSRVKRSVNDKTIVIVRPAYIATGSTTTSSSTGTGTFPKYNLTDAQIKGVANIIQHEQPDMKGYLAEASLMANLTDINGDKYATSENLVKKATGGWFAYGKSRFNNPGNPKASAIQAAKTVLVDGKRTLPRYINEHDCFSDIKSATNNGKSINKKDRSSYKQHVTKVKNTYGSNWTFYEFPSNKSDPFGYTSSNNRSKWGEFHYDANSLTSGYGTNSGVKPLAKYGQFKDSIYGKGSIYRSPYKNSLSIDKEIKLVNAEQSHEFGNGTSNYTNKKYGNGTYTESNNTVIINLINAVIKVLYEIADNTDKLNTIVSILNENLNINITAKDVSDNTGKYDTLKSKLQKSLNGAANSTLNNSYADTVNNSSMSAVIEIMNNIAAE